MKRRLHISIFCLGLGLGLAARGGTVFNDTFEPNGATPATRNDDAGPGFGLDIQWRPRVGSQAGSFSVVNDPVFGNALEFTNSVNNLFIIGQFDDNGMDDITLGSNSTPASLGGNAGDVLRFSMKVRTTKTISGGNNFLFGLELDPDGPLAADPGTDNTWIDNSHGYYLSIPNGAAGLIAIHKDSGTDGSAPMQGSDTTQLAAGITGVTAAIGADTNAHTLVMQFTRAAAAVEIDAYWDGILVSTATDTNAPYTSFNSIIMQYGPTTGFVFDNVELEALPVSAAGLLITQVSAAGGSLSLAGQGGVSAGQYRILTATNITIPLTNWTILATNPFDGNGGFSSTNIANTGLPMMFYRLQVLPPPAPGGLTATSETGQIVLSWNPTAGAASYNVKRSTNSGGSYATVASQSGTTFTNGGLTDGTLYYYVVSAVNVAGESGNSSEVSARFQATPPGDDALWIPGCGAYLGGWSAGSGTWTQNIAAHEALIGRSLDVIHNYHPPATWSGLASDELAYINAGRRLLINFKPTGKWHDAIGATNGGSASVDSQLVGIANSLAAVSPHRVMISVWHEPENDVGSAGTAADYVSMWHNVRAIFDAHGATNVIWVMIYEGFSTWESTMPSLWPGNTYVDWVMWDPYVSSASDTIVGSIQNGAGYNWFVNNSDATHAYTSKPWGLSEWGIGINGFHPTAQKMADEFNALNTALAAGQFPRLKMLLYFDSGSSTLIQTDPAITAYRNLVASPYMTQQCTP